MRLALALSLALSLPAPARADDFLVASRERGILRLSPNGVVREVLSSTHVSRAVMGGPGVIVFLVAGTNELRTLDIATRAERVVATLPGDVGLGCGGQFGDPAHPEEPYLYEDVMDDPRAMVADGARACFEVMDRNLQMASVIARVEVDLRTAAVSSHVTIAESCPTIDDATFRALPCTALYTQHLLGSAGLTTRATWSVASEGELGVIVGPRRIPLAIREPEIESTSIDGHWAVLSGNRDVGDYVYRSIFILDQRTGRVFSLAAPDSETGAPARRAWPAAISRADLASEDRMSALGDVISGETSLVWLDQRTLVVGETRIVRPGVGTFLLPGTLISTGVVR